MSRKVLFLPENQSLMYQAMDALQIPMSNKQRVVRPEQLRGMCGETLVLVGDWKEGIWERHLPEIRNMVSAHRGPVIELNFMERGSYGRCG